MEKGLRNKIILFTVIVLELVAMLAIYPVGLVRRDVMYSSGDSHEYFYSVPFNAGEKTTQSFIAQGDLLKQHGFAVIRSTELSEDWSLLYELRNNMGEVIYSRLYSADEITESGYRNETLNVSLKKGEEYSYTLMILGGNGEIGVTLTLYPEDYAQGLVSFSMNDELYPAQSFNQFVYSQKLNFKNVLFLWLFMWIVGLGILEISYEK